MYFLVLVDRIRRYDPSSTAATYWNRDKQAGLNRLILSTSFAVHPRQVPASMRLKRVSSAEAKRTAWSCLLRDPTITKDCYRLRFARSICAA